MKKYDKISDMKDMNMIDGFNEKQREAVLHTEGPLLVLAGAGSGKTSMMTGRIAYLITECGIRPENILAVTFTRKAAEEMEERVAKLLGEKSKVWTMTFHALAVRILRQHGESLGYIRNFTIYDSADQKSLMKRVCEEILGNKTDADIVRSKIALVSNAKNAMLFSENMKACLEIMEGEEYEVYRAYQAALKKNNAMDYDDLLINTVQLFEKDEHALKYWQNRFRYVMVDEYQDTNKPQYEIVRKLALPERNICVVGDDDQCIYEWRGADISNILSFDRDFKEAVIIKMEQNYRSTGNILGGANSVIKNNRNRRGKKLWTNNIEGDKITYNEYFDEKAEAGQIVKKIKELQNGDNTYKYRDFAILYRKNALSRNLEDALATAMIPYKIVGGLRYFDRKEIRDIIAYLRLIANPNDDSSFLRVVNEPKRSLGNKTVEKIRSFADKKAVSLMEASRSADIEEVIAPAAYKKLKQFSDLIYDYHSRHGQFKNIEIYDDIIEKSGYIAELRKKDTVENNSRIENIHEFRSVIMEFEEYESMSLPEFLENIALSADVDNNRDSEEDAVTLMTLHGAKGLEFPVVFMAAMEKKQFPGNSPDNPEEERRLCYVGMTRAKEKLFLSGASKRFMYGNSELTEQSPFIDEIGQKYIEREDLSPQTNYSFNSASAYYNKERKQFQKRNLYDEKRRRKEEEIQGFIRSDEQIYSTGDDVEHKKFGRGKVLSANGDLIEVMFPSAGIKKLKASMAPLKKM